MDIVLITVDSLRADHVGHLSCDSEMTPRIDALSDESLVFEAATAHGSTTFTSAASFVTGQHALTNPDYPALNQDTIAAELGNAGYHTKAISPNAWLTPVYGFDHGFDEFDALGIGPNKATSWYERIPHKIGDALNHSGTLYRIMKSFRDATRSLDDRSEEDVIHDRVIDHVSRDCPTFTWAHYNTVHHPYTTDPQYITKLVS